MFPITSSGRKNRKEDENAKRLQYLVVISEFASI